MKNYKLTTILLFFVIFSCTQNIDRPIREKYNKILVLGQNPLDMLLDLGVQEKIVGVAYIDNEEILKQNIGIPALSKGWPNKESVLSLKPDAIIALESAFKHQRIGNEKFWKKRGVKTCIVDNYNSDKNLSNYYKDLDLVGRTLNIKHKSDAIITNLKKIEKKYTQIKNISTQKALHLSYTGIPDQFYYYPPSMCLLDEIVTICGGEYINLGDHYFIIPLETIIKLNPDKIIVTRFRKREGENIIQQIMKNPHLRHLKAIKNKQIIEADYTQAIRGTTDMEAIYSLTSNFLKN
ncbi:ABC transporter substrate-binding protein [Arenibacter sp. M-2]|uniref:ABC transporter substrate-binding protein n=1 Tax=Arenibacter sp. M-2 TaxID=3053612 RepID=UPI0025702831|nr:ABC transporter substrate-binding protein [Arenibacter sp. M-2]MDL5512469.1 ABC transporter substrate-binding protein [Arenibacter sp. M-2]